jgi:hypothetical protein
MKILISVLLALSLCSCGKHDGQQDTKAKKDNVLQEYVEHPLNQAKALSKKVDDRQKKELDQAAAADD